MSAKFKTNKFGNRSNIFITVDKKVYDKLEEIKHYFREKSKVKISRTMIICDLIEQLYEKHKSDIKNAKEQL